uniref:NADH dehydrogenase [ubiquinone] 1 beta subcomplex subunit 9 n=1 Tax=Leptobrachium leishanense TaxID=445787 RepID=A0A8C5MZI4_9ANUR
MAGAYLSHQQKVMRLYKKSLRHLESWCVHRDRYRFFACLLRERFDEHKDEKDLVKATRLLKAGEEEFWTTQHPQPYIFPDSPGGTSYERYDCYKVPEWTLEHWHPSEKAMYPDYFSKREQWKKLREQSWDREVRLVVDNTEHGVEMPFLLPRPPPPPHLTSPLMQCDHHVLAPSFTNHILPAITSWYFRGF